MNFNLISNEQDNGHEYTVRFSTPVVVKPNSTCTLNFANLTRNSKIILEEDGKVTLTLGQVFPSIIPNDFATATPNNPLVLNPALDTNFTNTFTIPRGIYTFSAFRRLFNDNLNKLVDGTHAAFYRANNRAEDSTLPDNDITIGYSLGNKYGNTLDITRAYTNIEEEGLSTVNGFQNAQVTSAGEPVAYTSTSANTDKLYDNYGVSKSHYWHWAFASTPQVFQNQASENINQVRQNLVICKGIKPVHAMTGAICIGVFSPEYALMNSSGVPRLGGLTSPVASNLGTGTTGRTLRTFFTIECLETDRGGGANSDMRVVWGKAAVGMPKNWNNINKNITGVPFKRTIGNMNDIFGAANAPEFAWHLYLGEEGEQYVSDPRLYLRIYAIRAAQETEVIYDSMLDGIYIPFTFFSATDPAFYDDANKVNSQIPFSIVMSAQQADEGWSQVAYASLDKSVNNSDDNKPATIITDYSLSFNDELANVFLAKETGSLFPNHTAERTDLLFNRNMALEWRKKNYSIFLEQLPLDNMKNVTEKRQAGYLKNVLANIPTPFGISNILVEPQGDDVELASTYQPYNPIVSKLNNQRTVLNNMTIRIVDMETEELATEIIKSVVNFTINDPEKVAIVEEE